MNNPSPLPAQPQDGTYRVLVVSHDSTLARRVMSALSKARLQCHHAADVGDALIGWRSLTPHLIVLDLSLAASGAVPLCARIREESNIPILLLADEQDAENAQMEGLRAGADELLSKAHSSRILRGRVVAFLRRVYSYDGGSITTTAVMVETEYRPLQNDVGLGTDTGVSDDEKERAARAIAAAVQQISRENAPAQPATARPGEVLCDACGFSGALDAFRAQPGVEMLICPRCGESGMVAFQLD